MIKAQWEGSYAGGSDDLDACNSSFFFLLAHLFDDGFACRGPAACQRRPVCGKAGALAASAIRKFAAEEALMAEAGFPGLDHHAAHHRDFLAGLGAISVTRSCDQTRAALVRLIDNWVHGHLNAHDAALGRWVCGRPVGAIQAG